MLNKVIISIFLAFLLSSNFTHASDLSIDVKLAAKYFNELKAILDRDNGDLWGKNLYGKILFVEPKSRVIIANQQNKLENFKKEGDVFIGDLDKEINIANTAFDLHGEKWTMVNWDHISKEDSHKRNWLLIHESWHRIQEDIGFPSKNTDNSHLDKLEGRIYLKLEWRALRKALLATDSERIEAIKDALIFRYYRHSLFKTARKNESRFEMHEGLADYTGIKLSGYQQDTLLVMLEQRIKNAENNESFNWSFAYQNGPAYGILLDELKKEWRDNLKPANDFGKLMKEAISFELPEDLKNEVEIRFLKYNGEELIESEQEFEDKQNELREAYKNRFIENHVLKVNLINMKISFNPQGIFPLDEHGNVYKTARIVDNWGILEVKNGLLMDKNWQHVTISKPQLIENSEIKGDGWILKLNDNWKVVKEDSGNYSIVIVQ